MTAKRGKDLTIDEKIAFVVEMMHNRSFIRGRTAKKLAKEWERARGYPEFVVMPREKHNVYSRIEGASTYFWNLDRSWRLTVDGPAESSAILPRAVIAEPGCRDLTLRDGFVAIGPEGGWTDRELSLAFDSVGLGPGILRTETAAIVATTLCVALHH